MTTSIGIDIGGTKIAGGLIDDSGTVVRKARRITEATHPDQIVAACADLVHELRQEATPTAVGVAAAGYIDAAQETVFFAPNIKFRDEPLRRRVEDLVELPVVLENDANAAGYGEFRFGGGAEFESMIMFTLGTGVGGAIINGGHVIRGSFGVAGELGHMRVVPGGQLCGCGNHGCLEAYASGSALVREARSLVSANRPGSDALAAKCGGVAENLTGPMVTEAAQEGDTAAIALFTTVGERIGEAASTLTAVLDPEAFLIGGGVAEAGDLVLEPARTTFHSLLTGGGHRPEAKFALAKLGNDAGMIGAAALAADTHA